MGTDVHLVVVGGRRSLPDDAVARIERLEERWSRFRPASEVSRMNALAGRPVPVSGETLGLVVRALEGARITGGRFDPTVLGAVVRAGYDRSYELLEGTSTTGSSDLGLGWEAILVDEDAATVTVPRRVGFDPGGIGKGYAADLVVTELLAAGAAGACANVGGDLRAEGDPGDAGSWLFEIDPERSGVRMALVGMRAGALATSTRSRRTLGPAAEGRHHLIDPATERPASTGVRSASVVAGRGWQAEVAAKAAFVSGADGGVELLGTLGLDGLLIDDAGDLHATPGFARFTGAAEAEAAR